MPRANMAGRAKKPALARSNITACTRCRRMKKRCDQQLPACRLCEVAGVECVGYDAVAQRKVPRSYVYELETELGLLKARGGHDAANVDTVDVQEPRPAASRTPDSAAAYLADELPETSEIAGPKPHRTTTDLLLDVLATFDKGSSPCTTKQNGLFGEDFLALSDGAGASDSSLASLPPRKRGENLVEVYFDFFNLHLPLLHEPTFRQQFESQYLPQTSHLSAERCDTAKFFVNMVFALGSLTLQKYEPSKFPTLVSDQYYQTALAALASFDGLEGAQGVQALLLCAQFAYYHPLRLGGWNITGLAMRRAVELGMHEDPAPNGLDHVQMDTIRRTFWVAYSLDRNIAVAAGRPMFLSDGAITTKFPSTVDDRFIHQAGIATSESKQQPRKVISIHWFRYRRLQSEICTVLRETPPAACLTIDYPRWQTNMHSQIQEWYDEVQKQERSCQQGGASNAEPSRFELPFQRALLLLYRPSLMIPSPSQQALSHLASAASKVITLLKRLYTANRIHLFWQAAENIFDAGTALMYSYAESTTVRVSLGLQKLDNLTHLCSNLLWALVERFPAFRDKRDAFDKAREQNLTDFRNQSQATSIVDDQVYEPQQEQFQTASASDGDMGNDFGLTIVDEVASGSGSTLNTISDRATSPWNISAMEQAFDWTSMEDIFSWDWE